MRFPDGLAPTDFHDGDAVAAFRVPSHFQQLPSLGRSGQFEEQVIPIDRQYHPPETSPR